MMMGYDNRYGNMPMMPIDMGDRTYGVSSDRYSNEWSIITLIKHMKDYCFLIMNFNLYTFTFYY